jgi:putative methyltransferase (TIGR04325 family)
VPLAEWPLEGGTSSWEAGAVTARFKQGVEAFDLKADEPVEVAFQNPVVRDALEALARTEVADATLLDYGCGNAVYISLLSSFPATKSWKYVGADINAELIEWCRAANPGIRFEHIRTETVPLPFRDSEFDVVLASGAIQYIRDYHAFLAELHRVTNNYVLLSRVPTWKYNPYQVFRQTVHHKWGTENHTFHVFNRHRLEEDVQRSGFAIVYRDYSCVYLYVPNSKEVIVYHLYLLQKKARGGDP